MKKPSNIKILVINSGSSSIRFAVYAMPAETPVAEGKITRIGETGSHTSFRIYSTTENGTRLEDTVPVEHHLAGLQHIFSYLQSHLPDYDSGSPFDAIGHRIVHGGEINQSSAVIDDTLINSIREVIPLAPLHNPANLAGIEAARSVCPDIPQVAVFDTAFFRGLPPHAYRYAIPKTLYDDHHIRRYGFHGTSHQYVAHQAGAYLQKPMSDLRLVTLHLGNGASAAAIQNGVCIDTSMGMTPLEGLIMGTRCGDLDPSVHFYLARNLNMSLDEIESLLNHESGLLGLCGTRDMRRVHELADAGDDDARLAIEMFCYRIARYIGAYYVALGGMDALVFTGGIGENDHEVRENVCSKLQALDIILKPGQQCHSGGTSCISSKTSRSAVLVVSTNEELEIARQTLMALEQTARRQ